MSISPRMFAASIAALLAIEGSQLAMNRGGLTEIERQQLADLHAWHNVRDTEGKLLWYGSGESLKEQLKLLREISDSQRDIARILQGLVKEMDRKR